jgi:hypothetical protein
MGIDVDHVLGLANGTIPPDNGKEMHFLRVLKNAAQPSSPEEVAWLKLVSDQNAKVAPPGSSSVQSDADEAYDDLMTQCDELLAENAMLSSKVFQLEANISNTWEQHEKILRQLKSDISAIQRKLEALSGDNHSLTLLASARTAELEALRADLDKAAQSALTERVKAIEADNLQVYERNVRLANQTSVLLKELKRLIPPKMKCPKCEGQAIYYDLSTYRTGSDYDPRQSADVCSNCQGAGYIRNPDRQVIGDIESYMK